jgi:phosphoribosyl 1,2-cyclic phosphodiesterase
MKVTMRGCRGSIAVPGADTVKYGGNTTCIQLRTDAGDNLIFDAGTGIRQLGLDLMREAPVHCGIFITHTHWDHIQGLPFFVPLFVPGSRIEIFGSFDPVYQKNLGDILGQQMQYCFFPVEERELNADIRYTTLREHHTVDYGAARISNFVLNHPVLGYGYKVEADGRTFFFTGDFEPPINIYTEGDEEYEDYQAIIATQHASLVSFLRGVDAMVMDAQYTDEEYQSKIGWGHGTFSKCIALAEEAGVPRLYLTHHEPTRKDAALDAIYAEILASRRGRIGGPEIIVAYEGLSFEV